MLVLSRLEEARDRLAAGAPPRAAGTRPGDRAERKAQRDLGCRSEPVVLVDAVPVRPRRHAPVPGVRLNHTTPRRDHGPQRTVEVARPERKTHSTARREHTGPGVRE